jgi:glycosyltransferase involved in cell wall biosynthesis
VLHLLPNLNYGGMERFLQELAGGLDRTLFETHVMVMDYLGPLAAVLETTATLHIGPRQSPAALLRPAALTKAIRAIAPDVIHTHSGVWYKGSLAARRAGVRNVIHTEHGRLVPDPWLARLLDRAASRRTTTAVAVSDSVREILEASIVRGNCRIETVLNGVDTTRFRRVPDSGRIRAELSIGPHVPIIGSIGRLEPIKGYDVMIDGFARLAASGRTAVPALVIAGDGSQRADLEDRVDRAGLRAHVHLLGWRGDVQDLLSSFACFTLSSRSEGTSISLLEAMCSEICPVVTDVGGNAAVLGPELSHRLVPSESPELLAGAWCRALDDIEERRRDETAARQRAVAHYSSQTMIAAYSSLYGGSSERT